MELKKTKPLAVYINTKLSTGDLVIHPNDGFDLGLMNNRYTVAVHVTVNTTTTVNGMVPQAGEIYLSNACRSGTLEVSQRQWEMMKKHEQVILAIKDKNVFIVSNTAATKAV